ncbi:hypothetical protein Nepgr_008619 [Nepenthes gracilis]|uniref:Uncharacterized protein n=1 Tax=Nepenthes gracilis TaxID=150966 RepID=A0AAD3XJG1_NEPGR|nr:hypothetical protein Nepgr_008619 [Nepenthes gracilis]
MKYPPILDPFLEALAADLYVLSRWLATKSGAVLVDSQAVSSSGSVQHDSEKLDGQPDESKIRLAQLQHQLPSSEPGALMHLVEDAKGLDDNDEETKECKSLFKNKKFFLSREVCGTFSRPLIPSVFKGNLKERDKSIRSITFYDVYLSQSYEQLLKKFESCYRRIPPPHLSPFVNNEEVCIPDFAEKIKQVQAAARKHILPMPGVANDYQDDPQNLLVEDTEARVGSPSELDQTAEDTANMATLVMSRRERGLYEAMQISKKRKQAGVSLLKSRKRRLEGGRQSGKH